MERVHRCPERTTCRVPTNGAIFYGIAPKAMAYVQDFVGPDTALQTNTALTNILISNNSWGYGNNDYDIFAASYDGGARFIARPDGRISSRVCVRSRQVQMPNMAIDGGPVLGTGSGAMTEKAKRKKV